MNQKDLVEGVKLAVKSVLGSDDVQIEYVKSFTELDIIHIGGIKIEDQSEKGAIVISSRRLKQDEE
jgi:hypothetical protein